MLDRIATIESPTLRTGLMLFGLPVLWAVLAVALLVMGFAKLLSLPLGR